MEKKITITIKDNGDSVFDAEGISRIEAIGHLRFWEKRVFADAVNPPEDEQKEEDK